VTNEEFYDAEIAPKLLELARACQDRGISIVSMVEYDPGESGETCWLAPGAGIKALVAQWGVKCRGNIDSFFIAASRHGQLYGHSSMVLSMIESPAPR
jgi:hypothetical protein